MQAERVLSGDYDENWTFNNKREEQEEEELEDNSDSDKNIKFFKLHGSMTQPVRCVYFKCEIILCLFIVSIFYLLFLYFMLCSYILYIIMFIHYSEKTECLVSATINY